MSVIALVHVAHPDLALSPTIRANPETTIRVMPQAATDPETDLFFFFVEQDDGSVESAFESDHTVAEWETIASSESGSVYQLQHTPETILLSPKTFELGGLMREATSDSTGWTLRLQFQNRKDISDLWGFCEESDISFELQRIFRHQPWNSSDLTTLTDPQLETLLTAYEEGYFEEPRQISLEGLAEKLDISPTAVGGRLRRGVAALLETTLIEE
ncbi:MULTISPECIES: helix-turn-helix domain-containing protein [Halococcus]|uniref:helix-turn-helix domain-containing protein n=1 Tax=Halococcus TaxID=2249 RepID=UPI000E721838|nr:MULTISPECIES: helix-turn-helix domain-containing protein [Halococcus]RJT07816.1 helix-turn-helix domain-containing protein [Halococcus sp. IIIV-5B]